MARPAEVEFMDANEDLVVVTNHGIVFGITEGYIDSIESIHTGDISGVHQAIKNSI